MEKLSSQDSLMLRMEAPRHPFHVAGLIILKLPPKVPRNYLRSLAVKYGKLNKVWPVLNKKLEDPDNLSNASWIMEDNYQPERHVLHYGLPQPGRMEDLMSLVSHAHEQPLDRSRPLWETHIIEGLPRNRFALYCKVHHALIDGTGGMRLIKSMLSTSAKGHLQSRGSVDQNAPPARRHSVLEELGEVTRSLLKQYEALPQLSSFLSHMGMDALRGEEDAMQLPFTAPRSIFNTDVDSSRRIVICDLPFNSVRRMAHRTGGSINDVLLAVYGGALRRYLTAHNALPRKSLVAIVPISLKQQDQHAGNQLTTILSPLFTHERDPVKRLQRIIKVTTKAKSELGQISATASQDWFTLLTLPMLLLTPSGTYSKLAPIQNTIFSNVVGSPETLYVEGAEVEGIYPLSIVSDGMALNLTVASYAKKLCFAITSCPTMLTDIEQLGDLLKESFRELQRAEKSAA